MMEIDPGAWRTMSFDCYGTLIDWETGIVEYLQPLLLRHDVHVVDSFVLEAFAEFEPAEQAVGGRYRMVLGRVLQRFGDRLAFTPSADEVTGFGDSVAHWPAFADTVPALRALAQRFNLAIISNIDNDLFAASAERLQAPFAVVTTAEDVGAYKPNPKVFAKALETMQGPVLHVAQSRYHDIAPATEAGLDTVWINRPSLGAARPAQASPSWTFTSMAEFAAVIGCG